ncbi:Microtubule bundling protein [Elasticomyces elasticus]|uniref:Microtubule bundling protein n=1 Tax=Exophiala sideris TaxID=1016849 RepID=A0ABR0JIF0_9EURO|nr:Microtubule bundling protein [Elasticomyces elasticus]KAK5034379.1 Microtubule bundling protein [Exophiala sideris]KAK5042676.1 Microtubule bundling protein [Exophiala sideris]KAK5065758.1 Microtubule bundling protein [Exophiala sideris]KAK5185782.1 Microtubule bundling protein [Eurotiomycetes sp. CCFEE 6388]
MPAPMDTSYLTTQVTTIIGQLHSIFDEIGVPRNERESREAELFAALSETLHNQLRLVSQEKNQMSEEAQNIIKTIKQMEASLDDEKDRGYDLDSTGLRVTYPLIDCLRDLKEKYNIVSRLHRERFEQVKKLVQALESYSSHLESSFVKIRLPPTSSSSCPPNFDLSPSYVTTLDDEFTRVYDEYNKRVVVVQQTAEEIVRLWSELGIPQAQTDSLIVQHYRDSPEQLGLHQADVDRLRSRRDKLLDEKKAREKRLSDVKKNIENLWDRLGIEEADRKAFLAANRGCGLRTINEFEDELARLNELKRQNLHLFVEDARVRLQELWDSLFFSEEEMLDFTPAFSDVYSDALLSAHEAEIERLTTLKEQRAPILAAVEKYKSLLADRDALAASAADATRLMLKPQKGEKRDPGKLLREEKMRKRIAKDLPKVTADLTKVLQKYEDEYGRPFLIHGERFLDELEEAEVKAPPARSKTPNGLPPRSKTPAPAQSAKPAASSSKSAPPSRPASVMRGAAPRSTAKTPTGSRPGTMRQHAAPALATTAPSAQKSPSKIPSRVPLGNLKHGNNSPERRIAPHHSSQNSQHEIQHNLAQSTGTMGPPRAPPPRMRDLFVPPQEQPQAHGILGQHQHPESNRPASVVSTGSNESSRYVVPTSPEDVYDDRERMSYMSASLLSRNQEAQPLVQRYYAPHAQQQQPSHSSSTSIHSHSIRHNPSAPPSTAVSRQTSNTSSNMTTGTTASGSENWETFSDGSEMEPERDVRATYYSKVQQANVATTNALGIGHNLNASRNAASAFAGQMAPPPAKTRVQPHPSQQAQQYGQFRDVSDENLSTALHAHSAREESEAAWSTELEETY